eukprot:CAMPEP_0183751830 /NCGR_PEP_ID=MMETSP0739-20130205/1980_1 /TAXON_ID=385413 /ORGANISM="Thalassiosira miniscula, Strain CCMP1093" /LENGTH=86 /DNA_ID=CAMNT_0025988111 /DNA_START=586 /DNA_END=844 /DNA_ORIENTATION=+
MDDCLDEERLEECEVAVRADRRCFVGVAADAVVDNVDYLDTSEGHLSPEMADDAAEEDDADLDIDPRNSKAATSTIVSSFAMTYSS